MGSPAAAEVFLIVFRRGYRAGGSFDGLGLQLLGVLLKARRWPGLGHTLVIGCSLSHAINILSHYEPSPSLNDHETISLHH